MMNESFKNILLRLELGWEKRGNTSADSFKNILLRLERNCQENQSRDTKVSKIFY